MSVATELLQRERTKYEEHLKRALSGIDDAWRELDDALSYRDESQAKIDSLTDEIVRLKEMSFTFDVIQSSPGMIFSVGSTT